MRKRSSLRAWSLEMSVGSSPVLFQDVGRPSCRQSLCPGLVQLVRLTLIARLLAEVAAQSITVPPAAARLMPRPEVPSLAAAPDGGIQYCAFEGHVRKPENPKWNPDWKEATEPVLLHAWIRAVAVDGKLYARGFTFAQSLLVYKKLRGKQANGAQSFRDHYAGSAYLTPIGAEQPAHPVRLYVDPDTQRPNTLSGRGAQLDARQIKEFAAGKLQLQLRINNFKFVPGSSGNHSGNSSGSSSGSSSGGGGKNAGACIVSVLPLKARQLSPAEDRMGIRNSKIQMKTRWVVTSFHSVAAEDISTMLQEHVRYHEHLGVWSTHLYINTDHFDPKLPRLAHEGDPVVALQRQGPIKKLVGAGKVTLVPWTMIQPPESGPYAGFYHQLHQYGHAILAGWLEPVYMVMADLDEYVMLPTPGTIAQAMVACAPKDMAVAVNRIQVVDAECLPCRALHDRPEGGRIRDLDAWQNVNLTRGKSPLLMYTMDNSQRPDAKYFIPDKNIIDPFFNLSFTMHSANTVKESLYKPREMGLHVQPDSECIRIMHLRNLLQLRFQLAVDVRPSWWWPLAPNVPAMFKRS